MVTIWSDDFEDDDISDWTISSGTVEVTASPARGNYAIKAHDTSAADSPDFVSLNETTVDYWQIQNAQEGCYIYVFSKDDDALAGIRLNVDGDIQVFSKGGWSDTGYSYSINTWYHLRIVLDPVNNRYNAFSGITQIATNVETYEFTEVKKIRILGAWGGDPGDYGVWDNFVVTDPSGSVDLYAAFEIQTSIDLAAEFQVGQSSEELLGKFETQAIAELLGKFDAQIIQDLLARFEVGQDSRECLGKAAIRQAGTPAGVPGNANIRRVGIPVEILGRVQIGWDSIDLSSRFEVGQGAEEFLGRTTIRHPATSDLKFSLYVRPRHLTAAEMLIGGRDRRMDLGGLDRKMAVGGRDRRMRIR